MALEKFIYGKKDDCRHEGRASERRRIATAEQSLRDFLSGDSELYLRHGPELKGEELSHSQGLFEEQSAERGGLGLQSEDKQVGEVKNALKYGDNAAPTHEQGVVYTA